MKILHKRHEGVCHRSRRWRTCLPTRGPVCAGRQGFPQMLKVPQWVHKDPHRKNPQKDFKLLSPRLSGFAVFRFS